MPVTVCPASPSPIARRRRQAYVEHPRLRRLIDQREEILVVSRPGRFGIVHLHQARVVELCVTHVWGAIPRAFVEHVDGDAIDIFKRKLSVDHRHVEFVEPRRNCR